MASESHPAVHAVHQAARSVALHGTPQPRTFWQRLFPRRHQRLYDKVRGFGHVLKNVLDVPPTLMSAEDVAAIGADVDRVVQRAEEQIDRGDSSGEPVESFPAAIYTIRARYEQIYRKGGTRRA